MMLHRLLPVALAVALSPAAVAAETAAATSGSQACATIVQAAADGLNSRIVADQTTIKPPTSVTKLSCLNDFFNGTGLNLITNLLNPTSLLQSVEGQICNQVNAAWQSVVGSAQCGLTITGFNMGFGLGLGSGMMCPKLSFGGGGPPLGSVYSGYSTGNGFGVLMNGNPTAPTGYPVVQTGGLY